MSQSLPTLRKLHTKFGLIWRTSWPDKKGLFLKFLFREIQKVPYEILTFFLVKLYQKLFLFYVLITLVILHAKFGLIWTTRWPDEKNLLLKLIFREIQKVPYEILTSRLILNESTFDTPWKLGGSFFLSQSLPTLRILHTKFGLIWRTSWPEKRPIFNIPFSRNSKSSVWKSNLFPRQAIPKTLFVLHSNHTGDTPCRVWLDLNNSLTR